MPNMTTRYFENMVADALTRVKEVMPWDLTKMRTLNPDLLLLDVREASEFSMYHIANSINVPRGILESACEWDYEDTVPELADGHKRKIVVICRSGKRSALAADTMIKMGFADVYSLKTGIRGWNDFEQPLIDSQNNALDTDDVEAHLNLPLGQTQKKPQRVV